MLANFAAAVRSRKPGELHADASQGHFSAGCCHMANISYRLGKEAAPESIAEATRANHELSEPSSAAASIWRPTTSIWTARAPRLGRGLRSTRGRNISSATSPIKPTCSSLARIARRSWCRRLLPRMVSNKELAVIAEETLFSSHPPATGPLDVGPDDCPKT